MGGRQTKHREVEKNSECGKTFSEDKLLDGETEIGQVRSLGVANSSGLVGGNLSQRWPGPVDPGKEFPAERNTQGNALVRVRGADQSMFMQMNAGVSGPGFHPGENPGDWQ